MAPAAFSLVPGTLTLKDLRDLLERPRPIALDPGSHGAIDWLAAAVYEHGAQPDRRHEDDVLKRGLERLGFLHGAAAELDDDDAIAELADVAERLDQRLGLPYGGVHDGFTNPSPSLTSLAGGK